MIKCYAFDVEVLPNLYSIAIVNLNDYLDKFKDCVDEKGRPIPLTDKYTVKEIRAKLATVETKTFCITDFNDTDLLPMVAYLNNMQARYDTIEEEDKVTQIPVRYDMYGYNTMRYDNLMISALLMYFNRFDKAKDLITYLYNLSKDIINSQSEDTFYENKKLKLIREYRLPYASVDVMKVFHLDACGVNVDTETGERRKFGKSLKQTSINLKWHELLEFDLPPIDEKDAHYYYKNKPEYKGLTHEQLNVLVSPFDRYIIKEYLADLLFYNLNDVFIVCEMVRQKPDEIKLRYSITNLYKINALSSARSNIADKLVTKYYSEMSGLHPSRFKNLRTEHTRLPFSKVIFPHIKFKTKQLQDLLEDMKKVSITRTTKDSFCREFDFYGTKYTLATGGIHSADVPRTLESTDEYTYKHYDYASYYPSIMIAYNVAPKHLNEKVFVKMVKFFRDTRVEAKHTKDHEVIPGIPNKVVAEVLKIVINAIYGKLGSDTFFLYDRMAQLRVTINGQLMTMTLVEELELNGIHVVSANTDGIVIKLPKDKEEVFKQITADWNEYNKMSADSEDYKSYICRDVNNYLDVQLDGSIEYKGALDPKMYIKDLSKGYDMPIVAKAVSNYFVYNIPIMDTLHDSTNILDFCKTQNVGKKYELVYDVVENGKIVTKHTQRNCRFYVSKTGIRLYKEDATKKRSQLAAGQNVTILNSLDDDPIITRNIDYRYYYQEALKIIDPIKLGISSKGKGRTQCRKNSGFYNQLFDFEE